MEKINKNHLLKLSTDAMRTATDIVIRRHDYGTNTIRAEITDIPDLSDYENRVFMIFRKGSTVTEEYACETDKNTVVLKLPNAVVSEPGFWCAEIHFYADDGGVNRASSSGFSFSVIPDIDPSDGTEAEEQVQTLYSKIADFCRDKISEIGSIRFSIIDGHLTVIFADETAVDLGNVKGRDAVTQKGTVTLYSSMWDTTDNTYSFTLQGLCENGTALFKPATLTDKHRLEEADCFITTNGAAVTVAAENLPDGDITLEYVLTGG
ncbi:MAG: hypothetical protein II777_09260 [Clostridia bacterium]|nr:hypothetical protein [Clostridia bacterium]